MSGSSTLTPSIEVVVQSDGSTTVKAHGFSGSACRSATAFLERALGPVTDERLTSEFYTRTREPVHEHETS